MTRSTASGRPAATAEAGESRRRGGEAGTAIVGTTVGFLIFLVLMLLAVQMLVRLYATSALDRAALDAARSVAEAPNPAAAVAAAEADGRAQLGTFGARHTRWVWKEVDGGQVVLQVHGVGPGFLPLPSSWRDITRTVTVRTERFR